MQVHKLTHNFYYKSNTGTLNSKSSLKQHHVIQDKLLDR